jgi:hypothetical protein
MQTDKLDLEADHSSPKSEESEPFPHPHPRARRARSISTCSTEAISSSKAAIIVHQNSLPIDSEDTAAYVNELIHGISQNSMDGMPHSFSSNGGDEDDRRAIFVEEPEHVYLRILQAHSCYEAVPNNSKIVVFDTSLPVKKAFYGLIWNSARAALLWDNVDENLVGILSITDFIRVLLKFQELSTPPPPTSIPPRIFPHGSPLPQPTIHNSIRNQGQPMTPRGLCNGEGDARHMQQNGALPGGARNIHSPLTSTPNVDMIPPAQPVLTNFNNNIEKTPGKKPVERTLEDNEISAWRKMLAELGELKPLSTITSNERENC